MTKTCKRDTNPLKRRIKKGSEERKIIKEKTKRRKLSVTPEVGNTKDH